MIETVAAGLIVAAATGLTILAYRHPPAYARLFPWLVGAVGVTCAAILVWDLALISAVGATIPFGYEPKLRKAIESLQVPFPHFLLTGGAVAFYLTFLFALPQIVSGDSEKGEDEGDEDA
jgi:hypothetical protein